MGRPTRREFLKSAGVAAVSAGTLSMGGSLKAAGFGDGCDYKIQVKHIRNPPAGWLIRLAGDQLFPRRLPAELLRIRARSYRACF